MAGSKKDGNVIDARNAQTPTQKGGIGPSAPKRPKPEGANKQPGNGGAGVQTLSRITAIAVALAIIAAVFAAYALITSQARYAELDAELAQVVVTTTDIGRGHVIQAGDVVVKNMPVASIPEKAATNANDVVGRVADSHMAKGAAVTAGDLNTNAASSLSGRLNQDRVAISVSVNMQTGVAGLVHQGDFVRLIGTTEAGTSATLATNARVLALDANMDSYSSEYTTITVEVTRAEAEAIAPQAAGHIVCALEPTPAKAGGADNA